MRNSTLVSCSQGRAEGSGAGVPGRMGYPNLLLTFLPGSTEILSKLLNLSTLDVYFNLPAITNFKSAGVFIFPLFK